MKCIFQLEQVSLMNISCLASEQTNERERERESSGGSRHRRRVTAG